MKNHSKKLLLLFLFLIFPIFSFAQVETVQNEKENTIDPADQTSGLLYSISGNGLKAPSYLFGTIHAICPADMFGTETLPTYVSKTERLILEIDMDDPVVIQQAVAGLNMPAGKTLKDLLSPEKYTIVDMLFKRTLGYSVSALGQFNPIGLSVVLLTSKKVIGCAPPTAYETILVAAAAKAGKPVEGLESVQDQIDALSKMPLEKQAEDLYKLSIDAGRSFGQFKELLSVYKLQDSDKLFEVVSRQTAENREFYDGLLDERNKKWISGIEKAAAEKSSFIAVGAAHLGGENGVVSLLRRKGFILEAIKIQQ